MTITAMLFMSVSILAVSMLAGWCYYRVLKRPAKPAADDDRR